MKPTEYVDVDPCVLRLPWSRRDGADPIKLTRQISRHGTSTQGMLPPFVYRATDGELVLSDGVTRATRVAELSAVCPEMRFGQLIANLSTLAKGLTSEGLWDAEDEELLAAARKQLAFFVERRSAVA